MTPHEFGNYGDVDVATKEPSVNLETFEKPSAVAKKEKLPTVYDRMRAELAKPAVVEKTKVIKVGPTRPGFAIKFSTDLPLEKLDTWRIRARKVRGKEAIDVRHYNSLVIGSQCVGIIYEGEEVFDDNNEPLTFHSESFIESVGAFEFAGAIKSFFVRDADIIKIGAEVLEACGYTDDEDDEDPLDSEND